MIVVARQDGTCFGRMEVLVSGGPVLQSQVVGIVGDHNRKFDIGGVQCNLVIKVRSRLISLLMKLVGALASVNNQCIFTAMAIDIDLPESYQRCLSTGVVSCDVVFGNSEVIVLLAAIQVGNVVAAAGDGIDV